MHRETMRHLDGTSTGSGVGLPGIALGIEKNRMAQVTVEGFQRVSSMGVGVRRSIPGVTGVSAVGSWSRLALQRARRFAPGP